jgi:Uma2 family endonuclease
MSFTEEFQLVLPRTDQLPCSDDTPVDNEDQNLLPNILLFLLGFIWAERCDWFFAVDMAVYHTTGDNPRVPVVPDGFLSLQVERKKNGRSRRSYATWEENGVVPILVLEMVSHTPGGEYDDKLTIYQKLGVLYYAIYNPEYSQRDGHQPWEIYKLVNNTYQLQSLEQCWLPEIGLGIGFARVVFNGIEQDILAWFDESGDRYLLPEEIAGAEKQRADKAQQQADRLAAQLRALGISPDQHY